MSDSAVQPRPGAAVPPRVVSPAKAPATTPPPPARGAAAPARAAGQGRAAPPAHPPGQDDGLLALVRKALSQTGFERCAATLATGLAAQVGCDRVSVGMVARRFVRLEAVSHGAQVGRDQALGRCLGAAMDEAIDQGASLQYPPLAGDRPRITRAHADLARMANGNCVATVPMFVDGQALGAFVLERAPQRHFDAETMRRLEATAATLAPLLLVKRQADRSAWQRLMGVRPGPDGRRRRRLRRLFGGLSTAALAGLLAVPWRYEISAPVRLEGRIQRAVAAPLDGYLESVSVRPGDTFRAGQVLAELSDEDLRLERRRWQSEVARYENAYGQAQAQQDRAQLVIADARVAESRAQLALVEQQLARTRLTAPFDGVVLAGDLTQQLGAPVRRGDLLLTLAPSDELRVMLEVDPRDAAQVQAGTRGTVTLSALPEQRFGLVVERVMPVARVDAGRNLFEAQAVLSPHEPAADALRPGLQGMARLDAGQRPVYWLLTHRLVDWARLQWWSWVG